MFDITTHIKIIAKTISFVSTRKYFGKLWAFFILFCYDYEALFLYRIDAWKGGYGYIILSGLVVDNAW